MKDKIVTDPVTGKEITFVINNDMTKKRARSMWNKEKGTIKWLRGMKSGDHLLDIGANVGVYTLFASVVMGCKVTALEPESLNFAQLNKNIVANGMSKRVTAYPFAAGEDTGPCVLRIGRFILGHSGHQAGKLRTMKKPAHHQGTWKVAADTLMFSLLKFPTHIKVDVDGDEDVVMEGLAVTLSHPRVREVQVEIDLKNSKHRMINRDLSIYDFKRYEVEPMRTEHYENWRWRRT